MSTGCSPRGPEFSFQHPYVCSELPGTLASRGLTPSAGSAGLCLRVCVHTYAQIKNNNSVYLSVYSFRSLFSDTFLFFHQSCSLCRPSADEAVECLSTLHSAEGSFYRCAFPLAHTTRQSINCCRTGKA